MLANLDFFQIFPAPPQRYKNPIELLLLPEGQPGCLVLHGAKRRQRGCFQRVYNVEKGFMIHKQPCPGSEFPSPHSASPLSLWASSACSCSPAGRYKPWLYGRQPRSAPCSRREFVTARIWLRHRRNANGHRGPQLGPSPNRSPRRGQSCLRRGANGVIPAATFVPRTQSRLLFYGHEKLSWTVKISHSKFWYEAL